MTTVKDLKSVLEGFDENLDVRIKFCPTPIDASVDGHEAGEITAVQKTYVEVTYYYPLVPKGDKHHDANTNPRNRQTPPSHNRGQRPENSR